MGGPAGDDRRGEGLTVLPRPADEAGIAAAIRALTRGKLVLHPTETVVSLSGDPHSGAAVASARRLKGYRTPRPFLCLVPGPDAARSLCAEWPAVAERLARAFWPGPLTLVLPASAEAPVSVQEAGRIALRPAADAVSAALVTAWGRALFSTSANRRDEPPAVEVPAALESLAGAPGGNAIEVALVPVGKADVSAAEAIPAHRPLPSTIVDAGARPPRIVREGAIPDHAIREVVGDLQDRR
ncbi:MAG TPA: L-threonylcarbamoyladenylate synthase [Gemmatimonadota bacterium]|nr:L-threonylcarbamoyladenylate synthase [Gemmatimonadota bacterium]